MTCSCERKKERSSEEKNKYIVRLNRINGQINGIKKMIEEEKYCNDILIQLSAIDSSIKSLANLILDEHMHTCLIKDIKEGREETIDEVVSLFRKFQ